MRPFISMCLIAAATFAPPAAAQEADTATAVRTVNVPAAVSAVTVYRGRAAVIRRATLTLEAGRHDLRFRGLPETIQPETLQARISGSARVLEVQFDQVAAADVRTPETEQLDRQIDDLRARLDDLAGQEKVIALQEAFLEKVAVRAAADATDAGGTSRLDLDAVREQLAFLTEERGKLIGQRSELEMSRKTVREELTAAQARRDAIAAPGTTVRIATVAIVATAAGEATVDLTYLVANATWQPAYNIRAAADGSIVDIEYDALLWQRTGENWNAVEMTLSTTQPTMAANPPTVEPWFVDVQRPMPARGRGAVEVAAPAPMGGGTFGEPVAGDEFERLGRDADVAGSGPSVTYRLPRPVTVETNIEKQQRSRIATLQSGGEFVHVAAPLLTDHVYVRGTLTNHSPYIILPGPVSIFMGQDYVGPTVLDVVAPGGTFEMHFGIDASVKASRLLVEKKTTKTGLLGGGLKTEYDYRITIDNGTGKALMLELWDRYPVSRSDQITVELAGLSHPLDTDATYVEERKPQGLLKWVLSIPSTATGNSAVAVTWGVRINRAKNVEMTPLPD